MQGDTKTHIHMYTKKETHLLKQSNWAHMHIQKPYIHHTQLSVPIRIFSSITGHIDMKQSSFEQLPLFLAERKQVPFFHTIFSVAKNFFFMDFCWTLPFFNKLPNHNFFSVCLLSVHSWWLLILPFILSKHETKNLSPSQLKFLLATVFGLT